MTAPYPRISRNGEAALTVEFGNVIDPDIHARVVALDKAVETASIEGVIETLPTYRSLYVCFDPAITSFQNLSECLEACAKNTAPSLATQAQHWVIPICFEVSNGEDVGSLAQISGMTETTLIDAFCAAKLTVYMYGFAPGYAFLGKLPEQLTFARRQTPRPPIAPGTLISAGGQASIATCPMPTGWHVLGRTPQPMWGKTEAARTPFLNIGDTVNFEAVTLDVFEALAERATSGEMIARKEPTQ